MVCRSVTAVEAEYQQGYEEAMDQTKGTRSLEELLKGNHGKVISPPQDYMQLKLNTGSYCALLWSNFGEQCNYYLELLKLNRILDQEECFTIRDAYTRETCAQMTWAIINNGRSFLGQNPVASDFMPGARVNFLVSLPESITDVVHNALPIQCATLPREWITPTPTPTGQGGGGFPTPRQPRGPPTNSLAKYNPCQCTHFGTSTSPSIRRGAKVAGRRRHTQPKDQGRHGPLPPEVQQLHQSICSSNSIRQAHGRSANPPTILLSHGSSPHMLE